MQLDNLWFDVAIRGEHHFEEDLIVRFKLSDGSESGPEESRPEDQWPALGHVRPARAADLS